MSEIWTQSQDALCSLSPVALNRLQSFIINSNKTKETLSSPGCGYGLEVNNRNSKNVKFSTPSAEDHGYRHEVFITPASSQGKNITQVRNSSFRGEKEKAVKSPEKQTVRFSLNTSDHQESKEIDRSSTNSTVSLLFKVEEEDIKSFSENLEEKNKDSLSSINSVRLSSSEANSETSFQTPAKNGKESLNSMRLSNLEDASECSENGPKKTHESLNSINSIPLSLCSDSAQSEMEMAHISAKFLAKRLLECGLETLEPLFKSDLIRHAREKTQNPNHLRLKPVYKMEDLNESIQYDFIIHFPFRFYCEDNTKFADLFEALRISRPGYKKGVRLKHKKSEGKSGATFFTSRDEKIIFKEVRRHEKAFFIKSIADLLSAQDKHKHSFLPVFYGLFSIEQVSIPEGSPKSFERDCCTTFIAMKNVFFCSISHQSLKIKEVYDLKGSISKRFTEIDPFVDKKRKSFGAIPVLKDLNLTCTFKLESEESKRKLFQQLEDDVKLLQKLNVMDYSLLLGVIEESGDFKHIDETFAEPFYRQIIRTQSTAENRPRSRWASASQSFSSSAVMRRAFSTRFASMSMVQAGSTVSIKLLGHGISKRSRESSTFFRQSCHKYTYKIYCGGKSWIIYRRFKDFELLESELQREMSLSGVKNPDLIPFLPGKKKIFFMQADVVNQREKELTEWLDYILSLLDFKASRSQAMLHFLTNKAGITPTGWTPLKQSSSLSMEPIAEDHCNETSIRETDENAWMEGICAERIVDGEVIGKVKLMIGIIDVLQEYNLTKKLETAYKSLYNSPGDLSSIDSTGYADRFLQFLKEHVFV